MPECEYNYGHEANGRYIVRKGKSDFGSMAMYLCAHHADMLNASRMADPETKEPLWGKDGLPPHGKEDTEIEAAVAVAPKTSSQRGIVYEYICSRGIDGATDDEVAEHFNTKGRQFRHATRRKELEKLNLVVRTDERRKTVAGNNAIVFKATQYAQSKE